MSQTKLEVHVSAGNIYLVQVLDILINDGMFMLPQVTNNDMITVLRNATLPVIGSVNRLSARVRALESLEVLHKLYLIT